MVNSAANSVTLYKTASQGCACVWAVVVECKELTCDVENANHHLVDHKHASFAFWHFADMAHVTEWGHRLLRRLVVMVPFGRY